jgi:hypothetical protein
MKEFDYTETQLVYDNFTVKRLSKYVVCKLRNLGCIRLCPMAGSVPFAFYPVSMCIRLYLLSNCLGEKTLAFRLLLRFSLFTSFPRLAQTILSAGET